MNRNFTKEELKEIEDEIPLGRIGKPEDVAKCVNLLLNNEYITGQVITVDRWLDYISINKGGKMMPETEKKIIGYCEKHYLEIGLILITIVAAFMRSVMLKFVSADCTAFLTPWFEFLEENGGLAALANYKGDYNAPYMTIMAIITYLPLDNMLLLKGVSIIFDYALALSAASLVSYLVQKDKKVFYLLTYTIVLILPQVLMNGALWGQCDSIWATFVILAILYLLKEKYIKSFIMLGIAFSFKLQFIFILPLFIVIYICKKKYSILHFLIIPAVNVVLCLPAIIMGKPIAEIFTVYADQTTTYIDWLVLNFPNLYNIIPGTPDIFYKVGTLLTFVACAIILAYVIYKKVEWNDEKIVTLGLWFMVITTFLLPGMHERYLFAGEVLGVVYYIVYRKNLPLVICMNLMAAITYSAYLFGITYGSIIPYLSIIYGIIIIYFTKNMSKVLSE